MNYEHFKHKVQNSQNSSSTQIQKGEKNIFLVNMNKEEEWNYSELVQKWIKKTLNNKGRVAIIVNKKGYSSGVICKSCGTIPQCKNCSVSISYHKLESWEKIWLCHICKTQYNLLTHCESCNGDVVQEYGQGIQQVAERCEQHFKTKTAIIETKTANSPKKIEKIKTAVNDCQIIVATSLINAPMQDITFDLIIFLDADIGLNIPDYNANKHNFHFLYDTFTNHQTKNFIVQTRNPYQESIRYACKLDIEGFTTFDNAFKQQYNYPPFADLAIIMYKDEIEQKLFNKVDTLYKELLYLKEKYQMKELEIYSTPPLIYKIFGKYRYNIILKGQKTRDFMDIVYSKLNLQKKGFKIDRMAESIV